MRGPQIKQSPTSKNGIFQVLTSVLSTLANLKFTFAEAIPLKVHIKIAPKIFFKTVFSRANSIVLGINAMRIITLQKSHARKAIAF